MKKYLEIAMMEKTHLTRSPFKIISIACSLDFKLGAKPPSSPTLVDKPSTFKMSFKNF